MTTDPVTLKEARRLLDLIGDGDWTPQDYACASLAAQLEAAQEDARVAEEMQATAEHRRDDYRARLRAAQDVIEAAHMMDEASIKAFGDPQGEDDYDLAHVALRDALARYDAAKGES